MLSHLRGQVTKGIQRIGTIELCRERAENRPQGATSCCVEELNKTREEARAARKPCLPSFTEQTADQVHLWNENEDVCLASLREFRRSVSSAERRLGAIVQEVSLACICLGKHQFVYFPSTVSVHGHPLQQDAPRGARSS